MKLRLYFGERQATFFQHQQILTNVVAAFTGSGKQSQEPRVIETVEEATAAFNKMFR